MPLYIYTQSTGSRDAFLLGLGTSDYLDALVRPGHEPAVAAALTHVHRHRHRWDVLDLQPLRPASPLRSVATAWHEQAGDGEPCPVLPLVNLHLPPSLSQNLRYYRRRADRQGATVEPADAANLDELYAALQRLHAARWATRGAAGVLAAAAPITTWAGSTPRTSRSAPARC